jgi:hypothetical protein
MGRCEWLQARPDHSRRGHQKIHDHTHSSLLCVDVLHAKLPIHHHLQLFSQPITANMSEGEVEVASSSYEVLPKEVLAEVGSIKLFSTSISRPLRARPQTDASAAKSHFRDPTLTWCQL